MILKLEDITVRDSSARWRDQWRSADSRWSRKLNPDGMPEPLLQGITGAFTNGIVQISGPNGSGKTMLLQVMAGLILPDAGRITLDGETASRSQLRWIIGYLPQVFGFYPQWTAREMLRHIALLKGLVQAKERERRVAEVLQRTSLTMVADRKLATYSRGMRQAVGIAQALLTEAPVLIFDDPSAGLDPEARNKLWGLLMEIGQKRLIVWASSQITDANCADQVLILARGKNCFWGSPSELAAIGRELDVSSLAMLPESTGAGGEYWLKLLKQGYRTVLTRGVSS